MIRSLFIALAVIAVCVEASLAQEKKEEPVYFKPGEQVENRMVVDGRDFGFLVYVPSNYEEQDKMPLMMFMHGMGERGRDLDQVKRWGPPKMVENLEDGEDFPFILVSPQCPEEIVWFPNHLITILDRVQKELKVDEKRVYMTGLSMGGFATWGLCAEIPDRIAAAAPICGGGQIDAADKMIDVPIWAFHGGADRVVPLRRSQEMVEAVNAAGGKAKLTVYEDVGHNSWSETYANSEVYEWLLSKSLERDK